MFDPITPRRRLSRLALATVGMCLAGAWALSVVGGWIEGDPSQASSKVFAWMRQFSPQLEQGFSSVALFWLSINLLKAQRLLSLVFDQQDAGAMAVSLDEGSTVWIGRRYRTRLEAEAAAAALDARLRDARPR